MWGLKPFLLRGSSRGRVDRESPPGPGGVPVQRCPLRAPARALTPGREVVAPRPAGEGSRGGAEDAGRGREPRRKGERGRVIVTETEKGRGDSGGSRDRVRETDRWNLNQSCPASHTRHDRERETRSFSCAAFCFRGGLLITDFCIIAY